MKFSVNLVYLAGQEFHHFEADAVLGELFLVHLFRRSESLIFHVYLSVFGSTLVAAQTLLHIFDVLLLVRLEYFGVFSGAA